MEVVILAGGLGTRMGELSSHVPKALLPICGKPLIDLNLGWLAQQGFQDVCICTGHLAHLLEAHILAGPYRDLQIRFSREGVPRGTAGAVRDISPRPARDFLVMYGDLVAFADFRRLVEEHYSKGAAVTLVVHPNDHPEDSDLVEIDDSGRVVALHPKRGRPRNKRLGLANAGICVIKPFVLDYVDKIEPEDLFAELFPRLLDLGIHLQAYRNYSFVKDVGTVSRLAKVESAVLDGAVLRKAPFRRRPAVFLDRDGVLIESRQHVSNKEDLVLIPGVSRALSRLNHAGLLTVLVTNQPVVARGELSEEGLRRLQLHLEEELGRQGAYLDAFYYCPHHPDRGFGGEVPSLKISCRCRKPATAMGEQAVSDLPIDTARSFMIGDSSIDVLFGHRLGVLPIGVMTGVRLRDGYARISPETILVDDCEAGASFILDTIPSAWPLARVVLDNRLILIGGRSRSGKTLIGHALAYWLRLFGREVIHFTLDRWLGPTEKDGTSRIASGDPAWQATATKVAEIAESQGIHFVPTIDLLRGVGPPEPVIVTPSTSVIIEGELSLLLKQRLPAHAIYVDIAEDVARRRLDRFHRWKQMSDRGIARPSEERKREADSVVESRHLADTIVRWEGYSIIA